MSDQPEQQTTSTESGTPAQTPPAAATGTEPGKQSGNTTPPPEKTFTQADLDRLIQDRLQKQEQSFLNKLGVSKLDDAKTAVGKVKEIEDAQKTQAERDAERLHEYEYKVMQLEEANKGALFRADFVVQASKPGLVAGDRLEAAWKLLDRSKLSINDNGEVEGTDDALKALLETYPFLKSEPSKPNVPAPKIPASNPAGTGAGEPDLSWLKSANRGGGQIGGRGVRPPSGEN